MKESIVFKELKSLIPDDQARIFLVELINSLPYIVAILGEDRKLIYSNQSLLEAVSIPNFEKAFNLRPGELFKCVNSNIEPEGCGAAESCSLCGAFRAMEESKSKGRTISKDCVILSENEIGIEAYNFKYTSTPFRIYENFYYVISIEDHSDTIRKAELEKIFFHDILNSIGGIYGVLQLMKGQAKTDVHHLEILETVYKTLIDTVNEQIQFAQAQNGELETNSTKLNSLDFLQHLILYFGDKQQYPAKLIVSEASDNVNIITDEILLSRVLINMIKNAFEASNEQDTLTIGAIKIIKGLRFWVKNPVFIPRKTQLLMFERSFSTKGTGRGLGTFSMKLLGENYLKGKVNFSSEEKEGTTFWIDLPLSI